MHDESAPVTDYYDIGDRLSMGRHSYGKPLVRWYPGDSTSLRVRIGNFVAIADDVVMMIGGEHRADWVSTFPFRVIFEMAGAYEDGHPASKGDIVIGNDAWIGRGARILSGVNVGDGAVIGAYSVVTKDVRPYAIVAGNPAREVRRRFSDEQIEALLRIRWWEWSDAEILRVVPLLNSAAIGEFLEQYDPDRQRSPERS
jgi:acetyltransferase-like isoleucine patch superfamily enzyme